MMFIVKMYFLLFLLFLFNFSSCAQDSLSMGKPIFLYASLLYDFPTSYGIKTSAGMPIKSFIKKRKLENGNIQYKEKDLFISVTLGGYRYPLNYTGIFLMPGIGIRYYKSQKTFTEIAFELGMLRTFYDGRVYEVSANGTINTLPLFGRFYLLSGLSYALNFKLNEKKMNNLFIHIKPALWLQYPYNSFIKAHFSTEAGICYTIKTASNKNK
ncbi:MAG TPA: hypothetical protein VGO09_00970 [Flavisolibacter sp.]|nr:hypothetical protein [Flavisolibacter sp.]